MKILITDDKEIKIHEFSNISKGLASAIVTILEECANEYTDIIVSEREK